MNWLEFMASVIGSVASLAWPAVVVFCIWFFREQITPLIPHMRLRHKDTEFSFRFDEAEKSAEALESVPAPPPTPEEGDRFEQLVELSPAAAILEVRRDIEAAARFRLTELGLHPDTSISLLTATRVLRQNGAISPQTSALLDDLRAIGNAAAHDPEFNLTPNEALRFKKLANQVIGALYFEPELGIDNTRT